VHCGKFQFIFVPTSFKTFVLFTIKNAAKEKFINRKTNFKDHWLDYAENKHGAKLVAETKIVLNLLTLFLTLPLYWAIFTQSNSRWIFQATKMNGDLGFYTIKPDQMVMLPTIFIIFLIPIFDYIVYPILSKVGIKTQLQKVACGFVGCTIAIIVAAFIEWKIKDNYIHMLWLFPQYLLVATSEVFVWISTINFAYTQAPDRMKSVLTSFVYLTIAGGSLIVTIVSGSNLIDSQIHEYLMYSGLMVVNIVLFTILAKNYKFVDRK
jgi:dipeptide/tripeptide permease